MPMQPESCHAWIAGHEEHVKWPGLLCVILASCPCLCHLLPRLQSWLYCLLLCHDHNDDSNTEGTKGIPGLAVKACFERQACCIMPSLQPWVRLAPACKISEQSRLELLLKSWLSPELKDTTARPVHAYIQPKCSRHLNLVVW